MSKHIPRTIEPFLNSIIENANQQQWVINFYHEHIRAHIREVIDKELFGPDSELVRLYSQPNPLEECLFLRDFFLEERLYPDSIYKPLTKALNENAYLAQLLQDELFKALWQRQTDLTSTLPSYTPETMRDILAREVQLVMGRKLNKLKRISPGQYHHYEKLRYWLQKELNHMGPIDRNHRFDNHRFSLIEDPDARDIDYSQMFTQFWYFINGASRVPLFMQTEMLHARSMITGFVDWVVAFSQNSDNARIRKLSIQLPLSSFIFLLQCINLALIPYRAARTLVNELSHLIQVGLESLTPSSSDKELSGFFSATKMAINFAFYVGLLYFFSLPILPNPFHWLPAIPVASILLIPSTYVCATLVGACVHSLFKNMFPKSLKRMKKSAKMIDDGVQEGMHQLESMHKLITPSYHRMRQRERQEKPVVYPSAAPRP